MLKITLFSILSLLWTGRILGISFDSWIKFKAPSLTKEIGLDIGRTVFRAFHKIQWCFYILLIIFAGMNVSYLSFLFLMIALLGIVLILQTFWIFPHLSAHVSLIIAGQKPGENYYHAYYAIAELIKLCLLIACALMM